MKRYIEALDFPVLHNSDRNVEIKHERVKHWSKLQILPGVVWRSKVTTSRAGVVKVVLLGIKIKGHRIIDYRFHVNQANLRLVAWILVVMAIKKTLYIFYRPLLFVG